MKEYFEKSNKNKYFMPSSTNGSKQIMKKELWSKVKDLIWSIIKDPDDYDEK